MVVLISCYVGAPLAGTRDVSDRDRGEAGPGPGCCRVEWGGREGAGG